MGRTIKCKYCGKVYASPSEMRKRKCHSHPKGAWSGYCTPNPLDESSWEAEKFYDSVIKHCEDVRKDAQKRKMHEAEFVREYKKHTPLLDCMLGMDFADELDESKLQIRKSDLNQLALDLANGINAKTRDAINTVYALRAGCDYVLNNVYAQKEGSLSTWLDEIKQLRHEVVNWGFWVALYYLTRPIKDAKIKDEKAFEGADWNDDNYDIKKKKVLYWIDHSIATEFHRKKVLPMLRAVNNNGEKGDMEVLGEVAADVFKLKFKKTKDKNVEPRQLRCIETLDRRIKDYSFWGVLYCLYWMELRPTPWDDQKVWPIQDHNVSVSDSW